MLLPDIPQPDAPVIYTGAFHILTARPGRRSIYNIQLAYMEKVHPPLLGDDGGVVIVGLLILSYQSDC